MKGDLMKCAIPDSSIEHRFYIQFPGSEDHFNHLKGEVYTMIFNELMKWSIIMYSKQSILIIAMK
jgi:hypothetical protein